MGALVIAVVFVLAVPAAASASLPVGEPSSAEARVNGRVFGADPVNGPFSCSGISLATPSGSIVLTAGHCVYEAGRWARDLSFVPGYDHGRRPFGTFRAVAAYATLAVDRRAPTRHSTSAPSWSPAVRPGR